MITNAFVWLTQNPDQANAVAAVANVIVAALALIVAIASIVFAARGLKIQRQHNHLSVKPIPFIACADFEDHLRVKLRNDGTGPLLVKSVDVLRGGEKEHDELVSYMPDLPAGVYWSNFSSGLVRSVPPGGEIIFLELKPDTTKGHHSEYRDRCRKALAGLTISVTYTDIYGGSFEAESRNLDWFGRRLASSRASS